MGLPASAIKKPPVVAPRPQASLVDTSAPAVTSLIADNDSDRDVYSPGADSVNDPYAGLSGAFGGYQADQPRPKGSTNRGTAEDDLLA